MPEDALAFYAGQSTLSEPGDLAPLLAGAPDDLEALSALVRNLVLHKLFAAELEPAPPPDSGADADSRAIPAMLGRLLARQDGPLARPRAPQRRLIGSCRDYALLLAALLRQQGRPARLRVGFAGYFTPGLFADHWVCEIWDPQGDRWRLVDAELGAAQRRRFAVDFDPTDVPRERFLVAGDAWQRCRNGLAEPERFGVLGCDIRGLWFVAGGLLRDLAALNKTEMLPWDYWGPAVGFCQAGAVGPEAFDLFDALAALTTGEDPAVEDLRARYLGTDGLAVPGTILSFPDGRRTWLDWR